jgi:hypothetical protein
VRDKAGHVYKSAAFGWELPSRPSFTLAAFQFRLDMFLEPTLILSSGATSAQQLRWAAVLDLFGYYLATAVLAYVLWLHLRPRNPLIRRLVDHGRFRLRTRRRGRRSRPCHGRAHVHRRLNRCHRHRTGIDRRVVRDRTAGGVRAIWQFLDAVLLAAWWLGIG